MKTRRSRLVKSLLAAGLLTAAGCGRVADDQAAVTAGSGGLMGSSDAGSETTGSGGDLDAAPDSQAAICAPFRLEFGSSCNACPSAPIDCCRNFGDFDRCPSGLCLTSLDCPSICQQADADVEELEKQLKALRRCIAERPCKTDADCGSGRCVGEMDPGGGLCRLGKDGSVCRDGSDCLNGTCVTGELGHPGVCADRSASAPCNRDNDCASGWCLTMTKTTAGIDVGVCTSGNLGEPCVAPTDCRAGFFCVTVDRAGWPAECSAGEPGDRCAKPSDCKDRICVSDLAGASFCSDGTENSQCLTSEQCTSGLCERRNATDFATCVSGKLDSVCATNGGCLSGKCNGVCTDYTNGRLCKNDSECLSGNCALVVRGFWPDCPNPELSMCAAGICTPGNEGDPCVRAEDCASNNCDGAASVTRNLCNLDFHFGAPCGTGGICGADASCYFGRCGPKP